jgi:hypothetical protein
MANGGADQSQDEGDRRAPRRRVLLTGLVVHTNFSISFRCAIRDRSATGARLRLPGGNMVPPQFWLIEVAEGRAYEATAVWRHYPDVGVTLGAPIDLKPPTLDPDLRRLRTLWVAVAQS